MASSQRRTGTPPLLHLFCFFALSRVSLFPLSPHPTFACARPHVQLVKLSALPTSYSSDILQNAQSQSTLSSSQSALWHNGADGAASHPVVSELLRVLNLPLHTGTLRADQTRRRVPLLSFCTCGNIFNATDCCLGYFSIAMIPSLKSKITVPHRRCSPGLCGTMVLPLGDARN